MGKKVVTVECSDDEEDAEEEDFFRREEISRAPEGAVADGRSDGWDSKGPQSSRP